MNVTESDLIPAERQRKACHLEEEGVPGEGGEVWSQRRGQQGNSENEVHTLCLQALTLPHNGVLRKGSGHPPGAPGRLPGCTLEEKTPRRKVQGKSTVRSGGKGHSAGISGTLVQPCSPVGL